MLLTKIIYLIIGGSLGTVARYFISNATYQLFGSGFPYGTLTVNLLGCFIMGLLAALSDYKLLLGPSARLLLMIGFCGAFTTFSTLIFETNNLIKDGQDLRALANIMVSVIAGFIIFRIGIFLGRIL
ncbi:MAG: fluoride efflux transporter CrcB [Candidatus Omnitrophota bacterium]